MGNDKKARTNFPTSVATPSVKIFRGIDEVKNVYRLMLALSDQDIIYTFTNIENIDSYLKKWLEKEIEPKRISQKISKQSFITTTNIPKERWGYIQYDKEAYSATYLIDPIEKPFVGEVSILRQ